ncbi:UNVERIFIED_CONTAM: Eugenol synthase 1 [Sesamum latifolium]|uniref:Eugenol synthase 1 n=1 Tax=Sesamum latifolium TaxID=2727402 RepID=A0AAW2W954_9LAMI
MAVQKDESKILVFGGTGYIGSYIVKASINHPTYVFSRPNSNKTEMLNQLQSMGAIIVKGTMDEHDKLVSLLREVDVAISALAYPQVLDQLRIIEAIKVAGNIKRFLPSEFGVEEDRVSVLPPFEAFLEKKRKIRRAVEAANIPYTFVSANCCGAYFVNFLLRPYEQKQEITVYGSGEAKAVLVYEEDIGVFTIKVAIDPRACNRVVIYRPAADIISQLELISLWEKKTGRSFNKVHLPDEDMVTLSETVLVYEEDIGVLTIKVATDPRACNRVVIYLPAANLISQLELISLWEKKTGRSLNKVHVPEEEMVTLSESLPDPENIPISILHSVFVKGVTANFEVGEDDVEASALYPDLKVTTIDELLNIFLCNPPKPVSAAFA